jgi:cytochrome c biogenesis factor
VIVVGEISLWVALLLAAWGAMASYAGGALRRPDLIASGERAIHATFAFVALASVGLWTALLTHDFSIEYVARNTSRNMPAVYVFAAFWGAQAGSLLLWALILGGLSAIAILGNRPNAGELPWVAGTLALALLFLLATTALGANPFSRGAGVPIDGRGMNPLLQHPGMVVHPPMQYLGYVATAIPFALTIGALVSRRLDAEWLSAARRWSLASWLFLTAGTVLGMWWVYVEPGSRGGWAWHPVRSASLLPWLATTAFLYSIRMRATRRSFHAWNVVLAVSSFPLAILTAFLSRGGVIPSAPPFARVPAGIWFAGFLLICVAATVHLLMIRLPDLRATETVERAGPGWYGGYVAHAGAVVMLVALAGNAVRAEHAVSLAAGERFEATDPFGREWVFTSQGVSLDRARNREVVAVALDVTRDGVRMPPIVSEQRQYVDSRGAPTFDPTIEAGIRSTLLHDTYVVLERVTGDAMERAELRIAFNPLVIWVWIGGALMALGGLLVMWPRTERRRARSGYVQIHTPSREHAAAGA